MLRPALPEGFLDRPFAHRALHGPGRPENSRSAIAAALAAGYAIEIDLQLSLDGQAMVFHDYMLERLTEDSGPVRMRAAEELEAILLKGSDEGIPSLSQVLELVAGQVPLLIEFKDQDGALGPDIGALEEAAAALLADYDGPVAVMSFNPHSVAHMARSLPHIPRGLTTCSFPPVDWPTVPEPRRETLRDIPDYDAVGASFISHQWDELLNPAVDAAREKGAKILCWSVQDAAQEQNARLAGADQVTFEGYLA